MTNDLCCLSPGCLAQYKYSTPITPVIKDETHITYTPTLHAINILGYHKRKHEKFEFSNDSLRDGRSNKLCLVTSIGE